MLLTDQSPALNWAVPGRAGPNVGAAAETRSAAASSTGTSLNVWAGISDFNFPFREIVRQPALSNQAWLAG